MNSSVYRWAVSLSVVLLAACGGGSVSEDEMSAEPTVVEDSVASTAEAAGDLQAVETDAPVVEDTVPPQLQVEALATERAMSVTSAAAPEEAMSVSAADTAHVVRADFEGSYSRTAPGWTVSAWGGTQYETARETRPTFFRSGASSQRFKVTQRAAGTSADAQLVRPYPFSYGQTYHVTAYLRADIAASVEIMLRRDAAPFNVAGSKTVALTSGWTKVEFEGTYRWNEPGSLRVISKRLGANVYIDDVTVTAIPSSGTSDATAIVLPAKGAASTTVTPVATSDFEGSYALTAPGWKVNFWGFPIATYDSSRETRAGFVYAGGSSQRFRMLSKGSGDAQLVYPYAFKKGRTYRTSVYVRSDRSASVELMVRRDAHPWDAAGAKTVAVGSTWQKIEIQGTYLGDVLGTVRVISKTPGANIWVDNLSISEVKYNEMAPYSTATAPDTLFGVHVNKLGVHHNWPTLGQGIVRMWNTGTNWRDLEKANNVWDWTTGNGYRMDMYVNYITRNGGQILYTMGQTPQWASSNPSSNGMYGPGANMHPANMNDWRDYVRTIARRYAGKIKFYELWNEPDFSGTYQGSMEKMVEMARIASEEIKAADPTAKLVSPGVGVDQGYSFMDRFFQLGGGQYVDYVGWHFYYNSDPEALGSQIQNAREVMRNHGLQDKQLWNTEGSYICDRTKHNCSTWDSSYVQKRGVNARALMMMWGKGIRNFNYYFWERQTEATGSRMVEADWKTPTTAGLAYAEAIKWIKGARLVDSFQINNKVYVFRVNRGSENYVIAWSISQNTKVVVPSEWGVSKVRTLAGQESGISGGMVTLGQEPVMLKQ
ncbi:hypothetical protein OOT46_19235 [Aquabacterium sp. A7-Y]|uniref:GH39 family glycosyl hydrolase n=1 Tax=Aquabacterium sp. A7-Y TaxID=1349605 RepID=UPI00223D08C5|nr:hypothetical protein [Aquabacterium sp. A7-Y]MCW7539974.1 hypothetical protein [Aquabacterium sp. A7-Y]